LFCTVPLPVPDIEGLSPAEREASAEKENARNTARSNAVTMKEKSAPIIGWRDSTDTLDRAIRMRSIKKIVR